MVKIKLFCQYVEPSQILKLNPNETIYFYINDINTKNSYEDNDGNVTVKWKMVK